MADPYSQALMIGAPFANLGKQMFQGQAMYEQGRAKSAMQEAQRAAYEGHASLYGAQAQKAKEEAAALAQSRQYQTPEFATRMAANFAGLNEGQGSELTGYQQRGNWGVNPGKELPMDQAGPPMPDMPKQAPNWYTPQLEQRFNQARGIGLGNLASGGKEKVDDMTKAFVQLLGQNRTDQAIADPRLAVAIAQGVAAGEGKPLVNNLGGNGVFNQFTGKQELNAVGTSAANENNAQAGNASASAALHRAQIPEVQSRIDLNRSKIGETQTITNPDGTQTVIHSGKPEKALTESQAKATAFLGQMKSAEDLLASLEKDQSKLGQQADVRMAGGLLNAAASPKAQQIGQAQNQWSEAFLRFKTGAAATPDEVRINNMTFFPQIGDSKAVVDQKTMMRKQAANDMTTVAGPGASKVGSVYAPKKDALSAPDKTASVLAARQAIANGRDKAEVIRRLEAAGITDHGIK